MWGNDFQRKFQILEKSFHFILLQLIVSCYYCSKNHKKQSEHSGLRPDTSSFVMPWTWIAQVIKTNTIFLNTLWNWDSLEQFISKSTRCRNKWSEYSFFSQLKIFWKNNCLNCAQKLCFTTLSATLNEFQWICFLQFPWSWNPLILFC